jgi:hypothetical protein
VQKLAADMDFQSQLAGRVQEDLNALHPVEAKVVENLRYTPAFNQVLESVPEGVRYADDTELCARRVVAYIAYEYIRQFHPDHVRMVSTYATACTPYAYSALADEAAAALDPVQLQETLLKMAETNQGEYWLPYARYADD